MQRQTSFWVRDGNGQSQSWRPTRCVHLCVQNDQPMIFVRLTYSCMRCECECGSTHCGGSTFVSFDGYSSGVNNNHVGRHADAVMTYLSTGPTDYP